MPKTPAEVDALILTIAGLRDTLDADNAVQVVAWEASADDNDAQAVSLEDQVQVVRVAIDAQSRGAGEVQKQAMRVGTRQADLRRERATKFRMNAKRLTSLNHDIQKANGKEI